MISLILNSSRAIESETFSRKCKGNLATCTERLKILVGVFLSSNAFHLCKGLVRGGGPGVVTELADRRRLMLTRNYLLVRRRRDKYILVDRT